MATLKQIPHVSYIFGTLGKIQFSKDNSKHHDLPQEGQED